MILTISFDREDDGRWIADVPDMPGVMAYGGSRDEALVKVQALALQVLAEKLANGEMAPERNIVFEAA